MTAITLLSVVPRSQRSCTVLLCQKATSTGKCAAFPQNSPILQQTSPGLTRSAGKEHPSKLMSWQSGGASSLQGHQGTGAGGRARGCSGNHSYRGRSQQGARPCSVALVLHPPPGTNEAKGQGPSCCREGPGAVGGLAILRTSAAHLRAPDIIP